MKIIIVILSYVIILTENHHQVYGQLDATNQQYPSVQTLPKEYFDDLGRRTRPCPDKQTSDNKENSWVPVPHDDLDKEVLLNYMKAAREHIEKEASTEKPPQKVPLKVIHVTKFEPEPVPKSLSQQQQENQGPEPSSEEYLENPAVEITKDTENSNNYIYTPSPTFETSKYHTIRFSTLKPDYDFVPEKKIEDSEKYKKIPVLQKNDEIQSKLPKTRKNMNVLEDALEPPYFPNEWQTQEVLADDENNRDGGRSKPKHSQSSHKPKPKNNMNDERIKEMFYPIEPPAYPSLYEKQQKNKKYFSDSPEESVSSEDTKCVQNSGDDISGTRRLLVPTQNKENDIVPINSNKVGEPKNNAPESEPTGRQGLPILYDPNQNILLAPSKGILLSDIQGPKTMLMESSRICYACSSLFDPTCWIPDRRTTVKYCRRGNNSCLVKTYKTKASKKVVIRDCGSSCDSDDVMKYESCNICSTDMCNNKLVNSGTSAISSLNMLAIMFTAIVIKNTF